MTNDKKSPPPPARIMLTSAMSIDDDDVEDEDIVEVEGDDDVIADDDELLGKRLKDVAWSCGSEDDESVGGGVDGGVSPTTPSSVGSQPITTSPSSMSITSGETETTSERGFGGVVEADRGGVGVVEPDRGGVGVVEGERSRFGGGQKRGLYVGRFVDRFEEK